MNYSNMIEEKKLKKGFIIATLISTIVGTFTASMTLHDKVQEKRQKALQKQTDSSQDNQLKQMKEKLERLESGAAKQEKGFESSTFRPLRREGTKRTEVFALHEFSLLLPLCVMFLEEPQRMDNHSTSSLRLITQARHPFRYR